MEIRNLAKPLCVIVFFLKTVFTFKNYALTHNNKMGLLKESIEDSFWLDALCAFVFTINRLPAPILYDKFPHKVLFAKVTNYNFLKSFGRPFFLISLLQIGYLHDLLLVCSWVMPLVKGIDALILSGDVFM